MTMILLILVGIISGLWVTLSGGPLFVFLTMVPVVFILKKYVEEKDRPFIVKIVILGFLLRVAFMVLYHYYVVSLGYGDALGPDGESYLQNAWYISRLLLCENPFSPPNNIEYAFGESYIRLTDFYQGKFPFLKYYQVGIYPYLVAILYAVFDYSSLTVKLINSIFSVASGVLVYFIGKKIFNSKVAKVSAALFIFLPSIFIFSTTALKEAIIIFLVLMIVWLMMKYYESRKWTVLILVVATVIALWAFRFSVAYVFIITILSTMLILHRMHIFNKILIIVALTGLLLWPPANKIASHILDPNKLLSMHIGYVSTPAGNNYRILPDRYYFYGRQNKPMGVSSADIIMAFIKGGFHVFFEPVISYRDIHSKSLLFGFPQTILLLLSMPFMVIGLCAGIRYRTLEITPLTVSLIIFIPLMAISEGNVGTVFRHRDMIMPFLIILGVAGYYKKMRGDAFGIREQNGK